MLYTGFVQGRIPHTTPENNIIITKSENYPFKFNTPYHRYMEGYISEEDYYDLLRMINNSDQYKEWANAYINVYSPISIIILFIPIIGVFGLNYYIEKKVKRLRKRINIALNMFNNIINIENCGFTFVESNIYNDYLNNSYISFKYNNNDRLYTPTLV